jgi:exosortase A
MSADLAVLLPQPAPRPGRAGADAAALAAVLLALGVAQHSTYGSMLAIWQRSQTFAHGFIILPISLYLLWRMRGTLLSTPRQPALSALALLAGLGVLWLLAAVANVQTLQQYCAVAMLTAAIASVAGWRVVRAAAFPLAYLMLAVPFGEVFVPPLIDFTARFTVAALQLSGIPVFRDNSHLVLPSGSWDVVEACSGLRYVVASLALGSLFAYLNYRGSVRRAVFIAISLALPVVANGIRAYTIVLIGHLSNLRLATGIDHLVYGWLFFGLVSLLLFWCGAAWRDQPYPVTATRDAPTPEPAAVPLSPRLAAVAAGALVLTLAFPAAATWLLGVPPEPAQVPKLSVASPPPPWRAVALSPLDWQPLHTGHPQRYAAKFHDGRQTVALYLTAYAHQGRGAELLTPVLVVAQPGVPLWREIASSERIVNIHGRLQPVRVTIMQAGAGKLLVWRFYRTGGKETASPQRLKMLLAVAKLLRQPDGGAEIALSSAFEEQPEDAARAMLQLLGAMLPAIDEGLQHVTAR